MGAGGGEGGGEYLHHNRGVAARNYLLQDRGDLRTFSKKNFGPTNFLEGKKGGNAAHFFQKFSGYNVGGNAVFSPPKFFFEGMRFDSSKLL